MSYLCFSETLHKYTSIYDIKKWKILKKNFNNVKLCDNPVCLCPVCKLAKEPS